MTGPEFQSLYYTDCASGQGLRGGAGFQFQAVSRGVRAETMELVQRTALYEPPMVWMREYRPATEYPPSLVHVFDDVYVTARGIYLGREANGVREGNQFTHAVATADADAYGVIRPAQLWGAPWWSERPAPGTECDPVDAEPEIGPWGVDAVREWVLGQPDAQEWLTALHSALDRMREPDRRRVLFVAEDPADVLGWVAAGTLLLPQTHALRISFRVFAANPRYSNHDVLAVHPDWARQLGSLDRDDEFALFDLAAGRHSPVEPTEAALHWVPRFLAAGPDEVYDVVDAIELAHQFAGNRQSAAEVAADVRASRADRVIGGVVLLGEPPDREVGPEVLAAWLVAQPTLSTEDIVEPLATALLDCRVDLDGLRLLDTAVHRHRATPSLAGRVRLALLGAECDHLRHGPGRTVTPKPEPYRWPPAEREEAARLVERVADRLAPERMDGLLRMAVAFDVDPRLDRFPEGVDRFVRWWADHPTASIDPAAWRVGPALLHTLRRELARRFGGPSRQRLAEEIRQHWWPILLGSVADPADPVDVAITTAAVEQGDATTRRRTVDWVLRSLREPDPAVRAEQAWRALFGYARPAPAELFLLLERFPPDTVSAWFAERALGVLAEPADHELTARELDTLRRFGECGHEPTSKRLQRIAEEDHTLRAWLAAVAAGRSPDRAALRAVSGQVLAARAADLLDALLDTLPLREAAGTVEVGSDQLVGVLAQHLPTAWRDRTAGTRRAGTAVALAYLTAGSAVCSGMVAVRFEKHLRSWLAEAAPHEVQGVGSRLRAVAPQLGEDWREFVAAQRERLGSRGSARKSRRADPSPPADPQAAAKDGAATGTPRSGRFGFRLPGRRHRGE
jgi:hypothetical protein